MYQHNIIWIHQTRGALEKILIVSMYCNIFIPGEPFTQEEMEEMLSAAVDPDKGIVFYKDFVAMMVVEDI